MPTRATEKGTAVEIGYSRGTEEKRLLSTPSCLLKVTLIYRVYKNDWSGFDIDYIQKYGEQNYK